jgi:NADPH:quinone reductase-like Zn-dependent oxidoreductase
MRAIWTTKAGGPEVLAVRESADLTGGEGVDLVLDALGGRDWKKGLRLLRPAGRLVAYGFANITSGERRRPLHLARQAAGVPLLTHSA